jgi:hypothetical protein
MAINDLEIDEDNDINQQQIADCQVCCSPIELVVVSAGGDGFNVIARTDSE